MSSFGKIILIFTLVATALIYLAADLWLWHGPLHKWIKQNQMRDVHVVARVFNHAITRSQVDRAVQERLWNNGKSIESLTPESLKAERRAALDDLIDHELLRANTATIATQLAVSDAEIQQRLSRFEERFDSKTAMQSAMRSQGIASERELSSRVAAGIQQEKFVAASVNSFVKVTDVEARQWFDANPAYLTIPERIEVRHIFIPTLDHPEGQAKATLVAALADLNSKRLDFAALARKFSEDPASKDCGGALGWMARSRVPADFAALVFSLPIGKPTIVQTRIGWHLVEVTGRKAESRQTFDKAKPEIIAALEAVKRRHAIPEWRAALRRYEAANIQVYHDRMGD